MSEPKQDLLIYGREYNLWRDGIFLGTATWTDDKNIGDSFIQQTIHEKFGLTNTVFQADEWELIPENNGR